MLLDQLDATFPNNNNPTLTPYTTEQLVRLSTMPTIPPAMRDDLLQKAMVRCSDSEITTIIASFAEGEVPAFTLLEAMTCDQIARIVLPDQTLAIMAGTFAVRCEPIIQSLTNLKETYRVSATEDPALAYSLNRTRQLLSHLRYLTSCIPAQRAKINVLKSLTAAELEQLSDTDKYRLLKPHYDTLQLTLQQLQNLKHMVSNEPGSLNGRIRELNRFFIDLEPEEETEELAYEWLSQLGLLTSMLCDGYVLTLQLPASSVSPIKQIIDLLDSKGLRTKSDLIAVGISYDALSCAENAQRAELRHELATLDPTAFTRRYEIERALLKPLIFRLLHQLRN